MFSSLWTLCKYCLSGEETVSTSASASNTEDRTDNYGTVAHQRNVPEIF